MALNPQEKRICQAIIKEVEDHDIPTEDIVAFEAHHIELDRETISTVVIITKHCLYSFGRAYFKQLVAKYKAKFAEEAQNQLASSKERTYQCPHCVDGCSYCGYTSLVASGRYLGLPDGDEYQFLLHSANTYAVYIGNDDTCYGLIKRVRNPECFWENAPETYCWISGDGRHYTGAIHAADALLAWTKSEKARAA